MNDIFDLPKPEVYDFKIPSVINSISAATDILNRVPYNIAFIKDAIMEREEALRSLEAQIRISNPDKKQDEIKAMQQEDKECKEARITVGKAKTMLSVWQDAQKSAAKFYNN